MSTLAGIRFVTRQEWGAQPFPRAHVKVDHSPAVAHLEFHHDVIPQRYPLSGQQRCQSIERWHLARGWNGPFYNLLIDTDGVLYELRGLGNRSTSEAPRAVTVVVAGDLHNEDQVTPAQHQSMRRLHAAWPRPVDWHRRRAEGTRYASECPGRFGIPVVKNLTPLKESPMTWTKPGDPVRDVADAEAVFRYQGNVVRQVDFDFWADADKRVIFARIVDLLMQHDVRQRQSHQELWGAIDAVRDQAVAGGTHDHEAILQAIATARAVADGAATQAESADKKVTGLLARLKEAVNRS